MASLLVARTLLAPRDPLADAKDTLSSWDKCMEKTYCKWPVIVAIVVGSLIILSVVLCVARCICCGAELACCCFKCCSCCAGSGRSGHKRMASKSEPAPAPYSASAYSSAPPAPPPAPLSVDTRPINQQYRSHAAPTFNPAPVSKPEAAQFARFDSPAKTANDDALPAMPSWRDAKSMHVEEEVVPEKRGDMEMDRLDQNGSVAGSTVTGVTGSSMTGAAAVAGAGRRPGPGRSPVHRSPTQDSYGFPPGYQNDSFVSGVPSRSPGPYGQQQEGYRGISPVQSLSPVYGAGAGYAQNQQYDRHSPGPGYNPQYDRRSPGPAYDQGYDRRSPGPGYNQQQYNRPSPANSPPPLQTNDYGYSAPQPHQDHMNSQPNDVYQNANYDHSPVRSNTPGYAPSGSTRYDTAAPSYPGQQTYEPSGPSYPGQQTYQAFSPGQTQGDQYNGVQRKAVDGSWKEV